MFFYLFIILFYLQFSRLIPKSVLTATVGRRLEKHYCLTEDSYKAVARQSSKLHLGVCQLKEAGKWRQWVHSPLSQPFLLPFFPIRSVSTLFALLPLLPFVPGFKGTILNGVQQTHVSWKSASEHDKSLSYSGVSLPCSFFFNACCFLTSNLSNRERSH